MGQGNVKSKGDHKVPLFARDDRCCWAGISCDKAIGCQLSAQSNGKKPAFGLGKGKGKQPESTARSFGFAQDDTRSPVRYGRLGVTPG